MIFEVVVYNIESALAAQAGGADRIELCANAADGGTTPSYGTIEVVRQHVNIDLYVMIRPRGGDFLYSSYDFYCMKVDVTQCQKLSVDGIVFGILDKEGRMDKKRCKEIIDRARPLKVTCHRAFDMTRDPFEALEDCIELGFDRILTSGRRAIAAEGIELIAALKAQAGERIIIMPGSGITEKNIRELVQGTKAEEIHFSAGCERNSEMIFINPHIFGMGNNSNSEYKIRSVDQEKLTAMRTLVAS